MAPTFRSSRSGRQFTENASRSRAADHDVFEGLPIRRWTRQNHTVSQDAQMNIPSSAGREPQADFPFPELPMPKDSHLLAPQSRALLRAARAGYIYLRAPSKDSQAKEEKEPAETEETAHIAKMERSYTARKWSQLPKHVEVPEVEFLAKRRAGLPSLYGAGGTLTASTANAMQSMRKAKVKKIDPITGNVTIYDVWIPEGQKVEGEIKDESQVAPAQQDATVTRVIPPPGTVVDGVGVANAEGVVVAPPAAAESPSKRPGPPPPKRKNKSISGKSQKRVMFAPGEGADVGGGDSMAIDGEQDEDMEEDEGGVKAEEKTPNEPTSQPNESEPTPMALAQPDTTTLPPPTDANASSLTHEPTPPSADVMSPEKPALSPQKPSLEETPAAQLPSEDANVSSLTHEPTSPSANVISPEKPALSPEKPSLEEPSLEKTSAPQVPSEVLNIEPATNIEQQPQSPVRPQSEQLTPPYQPSTAVPSAMDIDKEPAVTVDPTPSVEPEVKAEVSNTPVPPTTTETSVGDEPVASIVAPESSPPKEPSAPVVEQIDTVEAAQPIKSEPILQTPAAPLPENPLDPPSNVESSLDKESKQPENEVSPPPAPVPDAPEQTNPAVAAPEEPETVAAPLPSEPPTVDAGGAGDAATATATENPTSDIHPTHQ